MNSLLLLIGTTRSYLFADFGLIYQLTVLRFFHPVALKHPNKWIIALCILLVFSSLFSMITAYQSIQTVARILVLAYLLPTYVIRFNKASKIFLVVIIAVACWQLFVELERATGYHNQATVFGIFGMSLVFSRFGIISAFGGVIVAASIARIPLAILWIYAILDRSKRSLIIVSVVTSLFLLFGLLITPDRFTTTGVADSVDRRIEAQTGFSQTTLDEIYNDNRCGDFRPITLKLFGYGFGGYCYATGQPTPHNVYKLSVYELGILAIPFWIIIIGLLRDVPYKIWLPLAVLAWFTDELFATPSGIYVIGLWLLSMKLFDETQTVRTDDKWYAG